MNCMLPVDVDRLCSKCGGKATLRAITAFGMNRIERVCVVCQNKWEESPLDYDSDQELRDMAICNVNFRSIFGLTPNPIAIEIVEGIKKEHEE